MEKDAVLFTEEGRRFIGKELDLVACERGFMDRELIPVTDSYALELFVEKKAGESVTNKPLARHPCL